MSSQSETAPLQQRMRLAADFMREASSVDRARKHLSQLRVDIDQLPLRQQAALLHEFEETETRLSAIAQSLAESRFALAEAPTDSSRCRSATVSGRVDEMIGSLETQRRMLMTLFEDRKRAVACCPDTDSSC